jgi:hypothetical protein
MGARQKLWRFAKRRGGLNRRLLVCTACLDGGFGVASAERGTLLLSSWTTGSRFLPARLPLPGVRFYSDGALLRFCGTPDAFMTPLTLLPACGAAGATGS